MILLSEAVETVGNSMFGERWTGEELKARSVDHLAFMESGQEEGPAQILCPDGVDLIPGTLRRGLRWRVITRKGTVAVDTEEEAQSLWRREKPKLIEMWRREIAARRRFDQVVQRLRSDLNAEVLSSWAHRPKIGDTWEIPAHVWARDDIPSVFELGDNPVAWHNPNVIEFPAPSNLQRYALILKGRVSLRQSDVQRHLSQTPDVPPPADGTETSVQYIPPYLAFMLRAARELNLKPSTRNPKDIIEGWLRQNWPDELGEPTNRKVESMATFLRHPEDQRGGYFKHDRDK